MIRALADYGKLMVWPANLHVERTVDYAPTAGTGSTGMITTHWLTLVGLVICGLLLYGATRRGPARPIRGLGAAWFIAAYLPISNLVPLNATIAEHWLYLPSGGLLIFAFGCCSELPRKITLRVSACVCAAVLCLGVRSFVRSSDWQSPESFYRHALASGGAKARMALNLGQVYADQGNYNKAEPLLRKVVAMHPEYAMAQNALGHLLLSEGKSEEAEHVFAVANNLATSTRSAEPRSWIAALNVAYMRSAQDDVAGAIGILQKANGEYPGTWPLVAFEAELQSKKSCAAAAIPAVEAFVRDHWWHFGANLALAKLYFENGDNTRAADTCRRCSRLDVHDAESLNLLALISLQGGELDAALAEQSRAVRRRPKELRQYVLLSDLLNRMGRVAEAERATSEARRLAALAQQATVAN
jgi:Flp pilus assembly protein TadD